jgi:uncharacterized protein YdeI (YjbR/CyaY-like superfamily)
MSEEPTFFPTPADFRAWLEAHHQQEDALWVGYYKKATGLPSVTWPESVDQALCFGWIDGLRKKVDEKSYKIRFTPRRAGSHWSAVNLERMAVLQAEGLVAPAGLAAFEKRKEALSQTYSYEQKMDALAPEYEAQLKAHPQAWDFFYNQLAPSYRKTSIHWVMSAKREATRQKRIEILIESSQEGLKIPLIRR